MASKMNQKFMVDKPTEHRKSMFSLDIEKVAVLKIMGQQNIKNRDSRKRHSLLSWKQCPSRFFEVSGNYLRYYKFSRRGSIRDSLFGRRPVSVEESVDRSKPLACIDLRLITADLAEDADQTCVFEIVSLVSDDIMELKASTFSEAKSWVTFLREAKTKSDINTKRRTSALTIGALQPEDVGKPDMAVVATTYDQYEDVMSYPRDEAAVCTYEILRGTRRNGFQIVSFNILADMFVTNTRSPEIYDHCDKGCLPWEYRLPRIVKHLKNTRADIICLQEVERKVFENDLIPVLKQKGYAGELDCNTSKKNGVSTELPGLATFYKTSMFKLAWRERSYRSLVIGLQIMKGKEVGSILACVNSHLEGAPWKHEERASQMKGALKKLERRKDEHRFAIICGDFNDGALSNLCQTVMAGSKYVSAYDNHEVRDITCYLKPLDASLVDMEDHRVDHIFFDSRLHLRAVMDIVDLSWKREYLIEQGLPNLVWPSDHLSIGAVFEFNQDAEVFSKRNSVPKPDPFTVMTANEIWESDVCCLSEEEKQVWMKKHDLSNLANVVPQGKPTADEIEALKQRSVEKESFIQSLSPEKQAFLRKYNNLCRAEQKKNKNKNKDKDKDKDKNTKK